MKTSTAVTTTTYKR